MKSPRGFTLPELMVTVAIIGVLAVGAFNITGNSFGASTQGVSDQMVSALNLARIRASATRRTHRVLVEPTQITIWQSTTTGLGTPAGWQQVQRVKLPNNIKVWNAQAGVVLTSGATPAQNAALSYPIDIRPDGQATASTVFVTNQSQTKTARVLVYHATGGSYARQPW